MTEIEIIIKELETLKNKARSYDKLVNDLRMILAECYWNAPESSGTGSQKVKSEKNKPKRDKVKSTQTFKKNHALWRCKKCGEFHVRSSRLIQINKEGEWEFIGGVQSPCTVCGHRQRIHQKDTKIFESKEDALVERDDLRMKVNNGSWL